MRDTLIAEVKLHIENTLKDFLQREGMELRVAANDNGPPREPLVELESIDDVVLSGLRLLFEIRVVLRMLGKPWQCDPLVRGVFHALHPHHLTLSELTVLLLSLHVEDIECDTPERQDTRATLRYIMEEC